MFLDTKRRCRTCLIRISPVLTTPVRIYFLISRKSTFFRKALWPRKRLWQARYFAALVSLERPATRFYQYLFSLFLTLSVHNSVDFPILPKPRNTRFGRRDLHPTLQGIVPGTPYTVQHTSTVEYFMKYDFTVDHALQTVENPSKMRNHNLINF